MYSKNIINDFKSYSNWHRETNFLGSKYPTIILGAMPYISELNLVSRVSNDGDSGALASTPFTQTTLMKEINKIKQPTTQPFTPNLGIAKKLVKNYGVDALIIESSEVGGHIESYSPIILVQEILPYIKDVLIFIARCIATHSVVVNFLNLGERVVPGDIIGVGPDEGIAHPKFKEAFVKTNSQYATINVQLDSNFPVNFLRAIGNKAPEELLKVPRKANKEFYDGN